MKQIKSMKSHRPILTKDPISSRGKWSYLLTMPVFLIFFSYLMVGPPYFSGFWTFIGATLLNLVLLSCTFFIQNLVNDKISRRFARLDQSFRRLFFSLLTQAVLSGIFLSVIAVIYIRFRVFGSDLTIRNVVIIYVINLVVMTVTVAIQEIFHSLDNWKKHEVNKEKLIKENLQSQLQSLKSQVSPHFLFNSLNSLTTLIMEEPKKAEVFVDQMVKVYRYLLQINQAGKEGGQPDHLTTLDHELAFIKSYFHLLKTRYGEGILLSVRISSGFMSHRLPPLTLQLLVENAVKHNVIRQSRPLNIEISVSGDGYLQVSNNLQLKTSFGHQLLESTRVGLANISAKYRLLKQFRPELPESEIRNGPEVFMVTLPLIPANT